MNRTVGMKDRRLIEALDYIDDEYIASAALYKMRAYAESAHPPAQTAGQSIKKYWRQFAVLAACLVLLAFAFPVFNKVAEVISSFAAGWGSESTTEEVSETQFTDENGIPYTYPMFIDDLEYLSAEEMININEAYEAYLYERVYRLYYNAYIHNGAMSEAEADQKAREQAEIETSGNDHRFFNENNIRRYKYYGKFGECAVLVQEGNLTEYVEFKIGEYVFGYGNTATMLAYKDGKMYELTDAYEMGLLTYEEIGRVNDRYKDYMAFEREWLESMWNSKGVG